MHCFALGRSPQPAEPLRDHRMIAMILQYLSLLVIRSLAYCNVLPAVCNVTSLCLWFEDFASMIERVWNRAGQVKDLMVKVKVHVHTLVSVRIDG